MIGDAWKSARRTKELQYETVTLLGRSAAGRPPAPAPRRPAPLRSASLQRPHSSHFPQPESVLLVPPLEHQYELVEEMLLVLPLLDEPEPLVPAVLLCKLLKRGPGKQEVSEPVLGPCGEGGRSVPSSSPGCGASGAGRWAGRAGCQAGGGSSGPPTPAR